jgi:hypothetical protein
MDMVDSLRLVKLRVVAALRAHAMRRRILSLDFMMLKELEEIASFDRELQHCLVDLNETSRQHAALQRDARSSSFQSRTQSSNSSDDKSDSEGSDYSMSEELEDVAEQLQMERVVLQRTRSVRELHAESYRKLQALQNELRLRVAAAVVTSAMLRFYHARVTFFV